jgi:dimethylglycine dehydrogenase
MGVLTVAGPLSRELLSRLSDSDFSNDAHPFFRCREIEIAGVTCRAMRLSYVGELGFELHHDRASSTQLYEGLTSEGTDLGVVDFGYLALDSMRLEKGYRLWGADITQEHTALEAGFEALVDWDKDFIGKEALLAQQRKGLHQQLVTIHFAGPARIVPYQNEPVFSDGEIVSWTLAGGWGHTVDRGISLAYVPPDLASEGQVLELGLLDERVEVEVSLRALYDPDNACLRS